PQGCGPIRRVQPEEQSGRDGDTEREEDRVEGDDRFDADDLEIAPADTGGDSEQSAYEREEDGLDKELRQDVDLAGTDGLADPDLAGPLGHGHQHDVHHPDAADEQR